MKEATKLKRTFVESYILKRIEQNKNFLGVFIGETGCVFFDTKLYGNENSVGELYNSGKKYVTTVSLTKQNMPIRSTSEIVYSGEKECYEIELENGAKIIATEDHILFKRQQSKFVEERLKNLKVGDYLRFKDPKKLDYHWGRAKQRSQLKIVKNYNPKKLCTKCGTLFYIERSAGCKTKKYCAHCSIVEPVKADDEWYLWEQQVIKNFFEHRSKEFIMELLPNRSWNAILHAGLRLGIRRSMRIQTEWLIKKNITDNYAKYPRVKRKLSIKMKRFVSRHSKSYSTNMDKRNKVTDIEQKMKEILENYFNLIEGKDFFYNQHFKTKDTCKYPDFTIPKLKIIIECDGDYWHNLPGRSVYDKERDQLFSERGYKVLHFNDVQIIKNTKEVISCLAQELKV
jgi:very-short-patch-repair endonuclease